MTTIQNFVASNNESVLQNIRVGKHVTFGSNVVVEPDNTPERKATKETEAKKKYDKAVSDIVEVNDKLQITVRAEYSENRRPGSRVSYCQMLGGEGKEAGELKNATDVICLGSDDVIITDMLNNKLLVFVEDGAVLREYTADDMLEPWAVSVVGAGNMAVTCRRSKCVIVIDRCDGRVLQSFGRWFFKSPSGIATVSDVSVVVTDDVTNKVSIHDVDSGKVVTYIGEGQNFKTPRYVTVATNGDIIVSDTGNHTIKVFDKTGNFIRQFGKYGNRNGYLKFPHGVCVDRDDNIFVADYYNNRIAVFDKEGRFCSHAATSIHGLEHPQGVTLTPDLRLLVTVGDLKATHVFIYELDVRQT